MGTSTPRPAARFYRGQRVKLDLEMLQHQRQTSNFGLPAHISISDARGRILDDGAMLGGRRFYTVLWDGTVSPADLPEFILSYA